MKKTQAQIEQALERLKRAGITVSSYTVYPGKGTIKANVTVEVRNERGKVTGMRKVQ